MNASRARLALLIGAALLLTACAGSGGGETATATIDDPWLRSTPNGLGAAYFTITMPQSDRLIAADIDPSIAGRVEVHEVVDDEGRMLMREVDGGIELPAGEPIELRPGGFHLMLLDMPGMLEEGSSVRLTLRFATAEAITVTAEVRDASGMDSTMHHGETMHHSHGSG